MYNNIWFVADTHFHHKNILDFEDRPFENVDEMEEKMIEAWNSVVGKNDTVYVVGDFCFGGHKEWIRILDQLKGKVILIKGNHDKTKIVNRVINDGYLDTFHEVGTIILHDKLAFHLTHYPLELGDRPNYFNISGHIHSKNNSQICQINVGVDSEFMRDYYKHGGTDNNGLPLSFGTPVSLEYVTKYAHDVNDILQKQYVRGM